MKYLISALLFFRVSLACLPTQQVAPTTTTTTPVPTPCSVCQPLYVDDCTSAGFACVLQSLFGVTYKKGPLLGVALPFGDADTCSTDFFCPVGTLPYIRYPIVNTFGPVPLPYILAVCQESGPDAGNWYFGYSPLTVPIAINGITCRGVFSG